MKKRLLLCLLTYLLLSGVTTANAAVIRGGQALGGLSLDLERFYERGGKFYEEEDVSLLSEVMYHENYCNGDYVMRLTGSVVLNRVAHKGYPNTVRGVLYQKGQYETMPRFFTKKIPDEARQIAKELLIFGSIAPPNVVYQAMFPQGSGVWKPIPSSYSKDDIEYFCYE